MDCGHSPFSSSCHGRACGLLFLEGWLGRPRLCSLSWACFLNCGMLLCAGWQRTGGIRFQRFYSRRALQLFPAGVRLLLIVYLVSTYLFLDRLFPSTRQTLGVGRAHRRAALRVQLDPGARMGPSLSSWDTPGRSPVKLQCYLLWPLALTVALRLLRSRRWLDNVAALARGRCSLPASGWDLLAGGASFERLHFGKLDTRADPLLIGSALEVMLSRKGADRAQRARGHPLDVGGAPGCPGAHRALLPRRLG